MVVLLIVTITLCSVLIMGLYQKNTNGRCKSLKRLEGKTALVTGGTAGMGLEIATNLAQRGARVIVACPFEKEGEQALEHIIKVSKNKNVDFKLLNLASLESVRNVAAEIIKSEDRLDLLINNAGVGSVGDKLTKDGMHYTMQINYYGHFLLTLLLLPLLKKTSQPSDPSRIVNTSSTLHIVGNANVDNFNKIGNHWVKSYGDSKFCLLLFSRELTKSLEGCNVVVNGVAPGLVGTRIFKHLTFGALQSFFFCIFFKNPWEGAQTALHVALDDEASAVSGEYFANCKLSRGKAAMYDDENARKVWSHTVKQVKLTDDELEHCLV